MNHFINITTKPIKSIHKGWFCSENLLNSESIDLYEIVTDFYDHPEASGYATISIDTFHLRKIVRKSKMDDLYSSCALNMHTQVVIRGMENEMY